MEPLSRFVAIERRLQRAKLIDCHHGGHAVIDRESYEAEQESREANQDQPATEAHGRVGEIDGDVAKGAEGHDADQTGIQARAEDAEDGGKHQANAEPQISNVTLHQNTNPDATWDGGIFRRPKK